MVSAPRFIRTRRAHPASTFSEGCCQQRTTVLPEMRLCALLGAHGCTSRPNPRFCTARACAADLPRDVICSVPPVRAPLPRLDHCSRMRGRRSLVALICARQSVDCCAFHERGLIASRRLGSRCQSCPCSRDVFRSSRSLPSFTPLRSSSKENSIHLLLLRATMHQLAVLGLLLVSIVGAQRCEYGCVSHVQLVSKTRVSHFGACV